MNDFFYKYFIEGWSRPEHYNVYDTLAYFLLALFVVYFAYNYLFKGKRFNYKSALSIVPFIVLGAYIRVLADTPFLQRNFFTVTPGVWLIFFSIITIFLKYDKSKHNYLTILFPIPFIVYLSTLMPIKNLKVLYYFSFYYVLSLSPFLLLRKKISLFSNTFNLVCIAAHMFDATSSFVNVYYFNYVEIHVLGSFLTSLFGTPAVMYGLKLLVIPILYYVDKEKDKDFSNYLKMIIFALGFGPGIRNLITALYGV